MAGSGFTFTTASFRAAVRGCDKARHFEAFRDIFHCEPPGDHGCPLVPSASRVLGPTGATPRILSSPQCEAADIIRPWPKGFWMPVRAKHIRRAAALLTWGLVCPLAADAQTVAIWTNPVDGSWTDPTRWSTNPFFPNNGNPAGVTYAANISASGAYSVARAM